MCSESPSLCEDTATPKLLTYMLNIASYSESNLFFSFKNTNKLTVVTHSFASLMPELPSQHAKQASPDTSMTGHCAAFWVKCNPRRLWLVLKTYKPEKNYTTISTNYPRMRTGAARRFSSAVEVSRSLYKHGIWNYIWVSFYSIASKSSELKWYMLDMYVTVRQ